ncbi:MAG TPA: ATPase, T2SS/T4P/T4SS family [Candidatus Dormibacteraeota bacterium]|nr:ATPase, T2SS/T4P/T4SS family [Candidatus Dormibacteraeota bacterium]
MSIRQPSLLSGADSDEQIAEARVLTRVQMGITEQLSQRAETRVRVEDRDWIESLVREEVERYHARAPHDGSPVLDRDSYAILCRRVLFRVTPLGPLTELLADPLVEEVIVNGPREVLVLRDGIQEAAGVEFASEEELLQTVRQMLGNGSSRLDRASPMVTATLEDGSRLNAVLPPVATPMAVTIRRHQLARFGQLADLAQANTLPWDLVPLFQAAVLARLNFVVSGGTGSGKTTMLRLLIREVPKTERIITIEDQRELHVRAASGGRANTISLEAREANTEGSGEITIQQLVRNALRQRPDRIFVGESRGPEALDVIDAMGTGHDGSGTTLHANSVRDALTRLAALVRRHPAQVRADPGAVSREIATKVDMVVHLARFRGPDGRDRRVVGALGLVTGQVEGDIPVVEELCRYDRARGDWRWTISRLDDLPAKIADKFEGAGIDLNLVVASLGSASVAGH